MKWTDPAVHPATVPVDPEGIPDVLRQGRHHVCWRWEWSNERGEWAKVPKHPHGRNASSTDPETWSTFEDVLDAYQMGGFDGIGYVLEGGDLVVIDLDECRVGDSPGELAAELDSRFRTYTEWSASGRGVHLWVAGRWNSTRKRCKEMEVYQTERYMTLTGRRVFDADHVQLRQGELDYLAARYFPVEAKPAGTNGHSNGVHKPELGIDDAELIQMARDDPRHGAEFSALFDRGDLTGHNNDDSAADQALCNRLIYWTDHDRARADRLFRMSALWRMKWDERRGEQTYGELTLAKADRDVQGGYRPRPPRAKAEAAPRPAPEVPRTRYPLDSLPRVLRNWTLAIADSLQTPPEVPATFALAVTSGAIGATRQIHLGRGWTQLAGLWAGVIAPPGVAKKSPSRKAASRPIHDWQQKLYREYRGAMAQYERDLEAWGNLPKDQRGDKPEKPQFRHCVVNDVTIEKLAEILDQTPRGLLLERDELVGWVNAMNQYRSGAGADRQHFLSIWSNEEIKVDRKSNPEPIYIRRPLVSILGGIQPSQVRKLGFIDDGLFERMLWCWPTVTELRLPKETGPDQIAVDDYAQLVTNLLQLGMNEFGDPIDVFLTEKARRTWDQLVEERLVKPFNRDPENGSRIAKTTAHAGGLALLIHLARLHSGDRIQDDRLADEQAVEAAWELTSYYARQSDRVFGLAESTPQDEKSDKLIGWIVKRGGEATQHDIQKANLPGLHKATYIAAALDDLEDRGYGTVFVEKVQGGTRRIFKVHGASTDSSSSTVEDRSGA